ncbi:MAG: hypothetical protein KIC73_08330 [Clostridiales bacterium]|nr:hypothetical protein [Clostridiales bacterium]
MKKTLFLLILLMLLINIQGCEKKSFNPNEIETSDNKEYNLLVTNNTPLSMKSIVVKIIENGANKNNKEIDALIDSNIKTEEVGKFYISGAGTTKFKITLNPKNNYSVSQEFEENVNSKVILKYEILIEQNEIKIKKIN